MSKHKGSGGREAEKKQPSFGNNPFKDLKKTLKKQEQAKTAAAAPKPGTPSGRTPPPPPGRPSPQPAAPKSRQEDEDERMFAIAMGGVSRMDDHRQVVPPAERKELPEIVDDDAEALARLSELVSGEGPFDIADTDEFIAGSAPGVDPRVLAALKNGDFAVQGHIDLHGMTKADAKEAVDRFLHESRRGDKRCVLIVHGRGIHSKDQLPVLKEQLQVWLNRGRIGKSVLAFATARPHDGGAGAVYVLLRR